MQRIFKYGEPSRGFQWKTHHILLSPKNPDRTCISQEICRPTVCTEICTGAHQYRCVHCAYRPILYILVILACHSYARDEALVIGASDRQFQTRAMSQDMCMYIWYIRRSALMMTMQIGARVALQYLTFCHVHLSHSETASFASVKHSTSNISCASCVRKQCRRIRSPHIAKAARAIFHISPPMKINNSICDCAEMKARTALPAPPHMLDSIKHETYYTL